ncbi:MAG: hypothetical protein LBT12_00330, partial [Oscillospiraceae bacterium]|nr:hypothetical protein [Oscillospiraceae bacterium]
GVLANNRAFEHYAFFAAVCVFISSAFSGLLLFAFGEVISLLQDIENNTVHVTESQYRAAQTLFAEKKYDEAIAAFEALGDYKDAPNMIASAAYEAAEQLLASGDYDGAAETFAALGDDKDSSE